MVNFEVKLKVLSMAAERNYAPRMVPSPISDSDRAEAALRRSAAQPRGGRVRGMVESSVNCEWGYLLTAEHAKKTCASAWKRIDLNIKARGHTFELGKKKN